MTVVISAPVRRPGVDLASLAVFRILFGLLMAGEMVRHLLNGDLRTLLIEPTFHCAYPGLAWLHPWPGQGLVWLAWALAAAALGIAAGLWYRWCVVVFWLGYTYLFLLDVTLYQNHYYLVVLLSFLMIWVPAHRTWSLDARRQPAHRSDEAPSWALWILRAQIAVVYVVGALAKLNTDWFHGEPMRSQLSWHADPVFVWLRLVLSQEGLVWFFTIGGLAVDLLAVPLLCWRRTRLTGLVLTTLFHLLNAKLWNIGVFPWLMIAATLLFLPPDWPRRALPWLAAQRTGAVRLDRRPTVLLAAYLLVQAALPLRTVLYPGHASWTFEGDRFAWRMKLRSKQAMMRLFSTDPATRQTRDVDLTWLAPWQASPIAMDPECVRQLCQHVRASAGGGPVEVRALVVASLNGRPPQLLVDPTVDLAREPRTLAPAPWIVPLTHPLPPAAGSPAPPQPAEPLGAVLGAPGIAWCHAEGWRQARATLCQRLGIEK